MSKTDISRVRGSLHRLRIIAPIIHDILAEFEGAMDVSQNGPPDGAADGTISPDQWNRFNKVRQAVRDLVRLIEAH